MESSLSLIALGVKWLRHDFWMLKLDATFHSRLAIIVLNNNGLFICKINAAGENKFNIVKCQNFIVSFFFTKKRFYIFIFFFKFLFY